MWKGEGNANVVFEYGGADPKLVGKVLRVRKLHDSPAPCTALDNLEHNLWQGAFTLSQDDFQNSHNYVNEHLSTVLGKQYIHTGEVIKVPLDLQTGWRPGSHDAEHVEHPEWSHAVIDAAAPAVLLPDLTSFPKSLAEQHVAQGPVVCIEVKPKCGFLPTAVAIAPAHAIKHVAPRFLLHQTLKLAQGERVASAYNPLDLFSGDERRVQRAIRHLFAAPQNNLKVFVGGRLVFGGSAPAETGGARSDGDLGVDDADAGRISAAVDAGVSAAGARPPSPLAEALEGFAPGAPRGQGVDSGLLARVVALALMRCDVLPRLLAAQRLDSVDVEGAAAVLRALQADDADKASNSGRSTKPLDGPHMNHNGAGCVDAGDAGSASGFSDGGDASIVAYSSAPVSCDGGVMDAGHTRASCPEESSAVRAALQRQPGETWSEVLRRAGELAGCQEAVAAHAAELSRLAALPRSQQLEVLRGYLVSATAKDCAVMVTLQQLQQAPPRARGGVTNGRDWDNGVDASGVTAGAVGGAVNDDWETAVMVLQDKVTGLFFLSRVALVDLDLKRVNKVPRHLRKDTQIVARASGDVDALARLLEASERG